jgi:hypothetical protein
MAYRSQHPMQDMESQNRFDLEQAVLAWKQDCASRPGISFDDARELESDLRERVADLLKQGLSEMEAFRAAVRQVGSPVELGREFARENPLAVWRERLFWMVLAGFAISIWGLMTNGVISWLVRELGELMRLRSMTGFVLSGQLPVLIVAVLLATGRLQNRMRGFQSCLQSRARLALTGAGCLLVGVLMTFFGPSAMQLPEMSLMKALFLLDFFSRPLVLLALAIFLLRSTSVRESSELSIAGISAPATVWRERVFWMAVGGLLVGFWQTVSQFGITALFYTGNVNRPYDAAPLLLMGVYQFIHLSPLIVAALFFRRSMQGDRTLTVPTPVRTTALFVMVPALALAWPGFFMWSSYFWKPREISWPWADLLLQYVTTFQWLWPVGLAALILWLAPKRSEFHFRTAR